MQGIKTFHNKHSLERFKKSFDVSSLLNYSTNEDTTGTNCFKLKAQRLEYKRAFEDIPNPPAIGYGNGTMPAHVREGFRGQTPLTGLDNNNNR